MRNLHRRLSLGSACVLLLITGCGEKPKPTGNLQGKVTFEGTVVKDAKVQLQNSETGEAFAAVVGGDGTYRFERPVTAGDYKVSVEPVFEVPAAGTTAPGAIPSGPPNRKDIPVKYRQSAQSGLTTTVKVGDNNYDIELKK